MNFLDVFILSIIESITEFLPVSSTGHMIVASEFLKLQQTDFLKSFEIIIQLGAILAIVFLYKEKIKIKEFSLWLKVLVSFLPVGIVGFIFKDYIKELFSIEVVASMFILGGIFILFFEKFYKKKKKIDREIEKITYKQALSIGVFQLFSFIPGTSRSLTTIFGGMYFNFTRKTATEFSFLMALPVMFAVCFYEIYSSYGSIVNSEYKYLILGFILSFIFTFFILKLFLKFVQRFSFNFFGIYRIIFGIILFLFFI